MYSQCAANAYTGASLHSMEWTRFLAKWETLSLLDSLTSPYVLLCYRLTCWQRECAYELYSVLIITLHGDHYIRFPWWHLIALSLCVLGGIFSWWAEHHTKKYFSQDHAGKRISKHANACKNILCCMRVLKSTMWDALMWNAQGYKRAEALTSKAPPTSHNHSINATVNRCKVKPLCQ